MLRGGPGGSARSGHRWPSGPVVRHPDVSGRLDAIGLADQTRISRFQLQGRWRLYGFGLNNVFHVVW